MKRIALEKSNLQSCVREAQKERIVFTQRGKPVALLIGVKGIDEEALERGCNDDFWRLIAERRGQETITRAKLEERLSGK